jgi:hypothetical protein
MSDEVEMADGSRCAVSHVDAKLATCDCGSGVVPKAVYVNKRFIGMHCRKCVRNYARG